MYDDWIISIYIHGQIMAIARRLEDGHQLSELHCFFVAHSTIVSHPAFSRSTQSFRVLRTSIYTHT